MKTITTIEQLEALPDRAVIKAADETILFCIGSGQPDWDGNVWQDEESRWIGSHDIDLPATLLHPVTFTAHDAEVVACCNRVRELHKRRTEQVITGDCAAEECGHEDECPTVQFDVCAECYRVANESDRYFGEYSLGAVAYPCPTIKAIEGAK